MRAFTRRIIVILCCCWLPLPALAAMAFDCHLLKAAVSAPPALSSPVSANTDHSGCGSQTRTAAVTELPDSASACEHCQTSCHTTSLYPPHPTPELSGSALQSHPSFAPPLPETVVLDSPQRPPQAV